MSVTIAESSPVRLFKRDDLPTFGLPRMTVFIPSVKIFPFFELFKVLFILESNFSIFVFKVGKNSSSEICSGSSRAASIKARDSKMSFL